MDVIELASTKGKPMFFIDNYLYEVDKTRNGKRYCRCTKKYSDGCSARAILTKEPDLVVIKTSGEHCHTPQIQETILRTATNQMKQAVMEQPDRSIREVYTDVIADSVSHLQADHDEQELGAALPSYEGIRSALHRERAKVRPGLPPSLREIVLEGEWTQTKSGANFLLFNDGIDDRILGFSTNELMIAMCDSGAIFMDGTFRVVPLLFEQLYTLHGFFKGEMIVYAYFLLPDKKKETYVRMFALLRNYATSIGATFNPRRFQLDFEAAALNAIDQVFPLAEVKGCHFHFTQCLWRKVQEFGLQNDYQEASVRRFVRCCGALALVPLDRIDDAWLAINGVSPPLTHPAYQRLENFKSYFIETWLENATVYPRDLWNHYRNFGARTTNHVEGWHQALNAVVRKSHVNLFEMIKHLQRQEDKFRLDMIRLNAGQHPPRQNRTYRELNERLVRLVGQLESNECTLLEYIQNAAHNLPSL